MNVTKSELRVLITLNPEAELPTRLLDGYGFPWEVVGQPPGPQPKAILRPLRDGMPQEVTAVYGYDAQLPLAQRNRILEYMSQLEACDWKIEAIFACADDNIEFFDAIPRRNELTKPGKVRIDAGGFLWGPLPLSPLEKPARWPYRAITKGQGRKVIIEPTGGNRVDVISVPLDVPPPSEPKTEAEALIRDIERVLEIPPGGVRLNLQWGEALAFARDAAEMGWEHAVARHFPHGLRLGFGPPGGGVVDETLVRG